MCPRTGFLKHLFCPFASKIYYYASARPSHLFRLQETEGKTILAVELYAGKLAVVWMTKEN